MARMESAIVNSWILDYSCFTAWDAFKNNHKLNAPLLQFIRGLLSQDWNDDTSSFDGHVKRKFLYVLSRIAEGEDISMRYDDGELSPLEHVLPYFLNLVNLQLDDDLIEEGKKVYEIIQLQAVMVHLRQKEYRLAQRCFSKIFTGKENEKDERVKKLKSCIDEKKNVEHLPYEDFIAVMIEYLKRIVDCFATPLLIVAAENHLKYCAET